eukprot:TRINITY_DN6622_c0_g1_i1.p1 TRINITY_DN6622_c0_g1~~TRINITY_DN6622_c0_g1_i1.p1  ORF type:complete len:351 (-),score=87.56 TRINITY_DN6622_c0_g1_i1:35-1087(-)
MKISQNKILFLSFFILISTAFAQISNCPTFGRHKPANIYDVYPSSIDVVANLGDSITAGFGIEGRKGYLDEFRGMSFPIGGDENQTTVFNFIKHYNPNVFGASIGKHLVELPGWPYYKDDYMNAAQSNAASENLEMQIKRLLTVMNDNKINNNSTYKFINFLMGANDICPACDGNKIGNAQQILATYQTNVQNAFTQLKANFPNTIVNVLPMFNISKIITLASNLTYCMEFHKIIPVECPCAWSQNDTVRNWADDVIAGFDDILTNVTQNINDNSFAVVFQPFTRNLVIPNESYVSTLDCFHPSLLAHQALAVSVWNSMLLPVGQKPTTWNPDQLLQCATSSSKIFTSTS